MCVADLVDMPKYPLKAFDRTGLCQVLPTTASSCPCRTNGIRDQDVIIDGVESTVVLVPSKADWVALNDAHETEFSARAETNGSYSCKIQFEAIFSIGIEIWEHS